MFLSHTFSVPPYASASSLFIISAAVLESEGYAVDLIEFVDFEHSPKNLMIRASYTGKHRTGGRERAEALQRSYGFRQSLLELTAAHTQEE